LEPLKIQKKAENSLDIFREANLERANKLLLLENTRLKEELASMKAKPSERDKYQQLQNKCEQLERTLFQLTNEERGLQRKLTEGKYELDMTK
jgi:hypothetical protein